MDTLLIKNLESNPWYDDVVFKGWSEFLPWTACRTTIGGDMGTSNEDFEVEEIPAYLPSGSGEHLYLWIEKSGKGTPEVLKSVQAAFGVKEIAIGYAGKKDAHAVTRQWVSVHTPSDDPQPIDALNALGWMRVLKTTRHANKLRLGHLRGNLFKVRIYGATQDDKQIDSAIDTLKKNGFINYFGKQRFGFDGSNVAQGMHVLAGQKMPHQKRLLLVSAVQSAIFNCMAAQRFEEVADAATKGDVLQKIHSGCFICEDPDTDSSRIRENCVAVTLPLFGKKYMSSSGYARDLECRCSDAFFHDWTKAFSCDGDVAFDLHGLSKFASGDRRQFIIRPEILTFIRNDADCIEVRFALPSGCYATVLLRHLCGASFTR